MPKHLEKFASQARLGHAGSRRLLLALCKSLPDQARQCAVEMDRPICHAIAGLIAKRAELLARRFG